MTRDDVLAATREAAVSADAVADHLERLRHRLEPAFPLDPVVLAGWDDDPRERLHALLRMYEQLFDLTSRKLFRGYLFLAGETIAGMSAQNQFRRIEALGPLSDADRWIELGTIRNMLVHDYPSNPVAQATRANLAWNALPDLIAQTRSVVATLRAEGHLA